MGSGDVEGDNMGVGVGVGVGVAVGVGAAAISKDTGIALLAWVPVSSM